MHLRGNAPQGGAVAALPDEWTWDHSSVGTISVAGNLVKMLDPPLSLTPANSHVTFVFETEQLILKSS